MQVELLSMAFLAIAVFVILVCYNLLWHNFTPCLHTGLFERPRTKKEALLAVFLQPDIKSLLFLGAAFLGIFISITFTIGDTMDIQKNTIIEVEHDQKTHQAWQ